VASVEKRTVLFETKLNDQTGAALRTMAGNFARFATGTAGTLKGVVSSVFNLKTAIVGLGTAFVGNKIVAGMQAIAKEGGKLYETSRKLGVSTRILSEFKHAFEQLGSSGDQALNALGKLNKTIGEVTRGDNREALRAFRDLGISLSELRTLSVDQVFDRISDGLARYKSEAEKAALANKVFGRGVADELLPVFAEQRGAFDDARRDAQRLGLVLGDLEAKQLDDFGDAITKLKATVGSVFRDMVVKLAPDMTKALESWSTWVGDNRGPILKFFEDAAALLSTIVSLGAKVAAIPRWINQIGANLPKNPGLSEWEQLAGSSFPNNPFGIGRPGGTGGAGTGMPSPKEQARLWSQSAIGMRKDFGLPPMQFGGQGQGPNTPTPIGPGLPGAPGGGAGAMPGADAFGKFFEGFGDGVQKMKAEWESFTEAGEEAAVKLGRTMETSITSNLTDVVLGAKSGKEAFREFGQTMIRQLIEMAIQLMIVRPLMAGLFGGIAPMAKGGIVQGRSSNWEAMGIPGYAAGTVVTSPHLAMVGEGSKNEAIVPLPDNRSIPVSFLNGGGGGNEFNFHLHSPDQKGMRRLLLDEREQIAAIAEWAMTKRSRGRTTVRSLT